MLISHSHRFIFFHVAKTGGLSARSILSAYAEEPSKFKIKRPAKEKNGKPNRLYDAWETLLLHAKARDARRELPADVFAPYFKFAFVRNPWDWHVSMYHFLLGKPENPRYETIAALGSFDAYVEWVANEKAPFPKGTTKLQKDTITDGNGALLVDFIGRFETLNQDFATICQKLNINATLPHKNKSNRRDYRDYYTPQTKALIANHFQADIELFGYSFEHQTTSNSLN